MRTLKEIDEEIRGLQEQRRNIEEKIKLLNNERGERMFADFCEKYNVKKGDIVKTLSYGEVQICGMSGTYCTPWVICRKIKNNGEPYQSTVTHMAESFKGCTVVGHIDI